MEFSHRLLLCLPVVVVVWWVLAAAAAAAATTDDTVAVSPRPNCTTTTKCGDIDVPYPFSLQRRCAINNDKRFHLDCKKTAGITKLLHGNFEVINISVQHHKARLKTPVPRQCYNESPKPKMMKMITIESTPYVLSRRDNKIIVLGCNSVSYMISNHYRVGCSPACVENPVNGTCHLNAGCCQLDIPWDVKSTRALFVPLNNTWREYPCNLITVMDKKAIKSSATNITSMAFTHNATVPVVMDWGIPNKKCEDAKNLKDYACVSKNSECNDTDAGYDTCSCSSGYNGNPYLVNGCKDYNIDLLG